MSGKDSKRLVNPLLTASVIGGTIEDFSQNVILHPAASPPTVPQPIQTQGREELLPTQELIPQPPSNSVPEQFGTFAEIQPQVQPHIQPQPSLQSVFSSFSSYLNLGATSNTAHTITPPSVVDEVLNQPIAEYATSPVTPVPLYAPDGQLNNFVQQTHTPPIPKGSTNSYRRKDTKRPVYAPIPGLSNSSSAQNFPKTTTTTPTQPPTSNTNITSYFQPELSSYATLTPIIPNIPQISSVKSEGFETPFLQPVESSEITLTPITPFYTRDTTSPTKITPNNTYSQPTFVPTIMATNEARLPDINDSYSSLSESERILLSDGPKISHVYRPVYHHWFFKTELESKSIWSPFTMMDSLNLEAAYLSNDLSPDKIVATDGGRYDVNILRRERTSVYWTSKLSEVRRCSWFHKGNADGKYVPYEENVATKLEEEFKQAFESNVWNRKIELASGETVIFHGPDVLVLFPQMQSPDSWGNTPNQPRPKVIKRGMDEFHIEEGEPTEIDHLIFIVHGIGAACDLKFRTVSEVVDEFRSISLQLVQSHYRSSCETGVVNRIEILPISWHEKLHSEDTGVDKKLKSITLESIPRLRDFANDTILDVLFYTSPVYCQTIVASVGNELNRIYDLFKKRNPKFNGGTSLTGHSLGSLILFDLLCHQHPEPEPTPVIPIDEEESAEDDIVTPLKPSPKDRKMSRRISYMMGKMGTGQPQINYPHLSFTPKHFFALGSPIGMFVTVRGLNTLGEQFALPTCPTFFNIFHPYDPVAYRIESLINSELADLKPVLIPHHKGRKRMHLELKETMARVGADLKQKVIDSMKSTWNSFNQFYLFKSPQNPPNLEEEVDKVIKEQLKEEPEDDQDSNPEIETTHFSLGILNQGRRIDYVLQEAPLEFINEYIFALTSHVCYWESEDTILLITKEIYNSMEVKPDSQIPQQTMTIERPMNENMGVDPTLPMTTITNIGPPPISGFVRKS